MVNFFLGIFISISIIEFLLIILLYKFLRKIYHNDFYDNINSVFDKFLKGEDYDE